MINGTTIAPKVTRSLVDNLPDILGDGYEVRQSQVDMAAQVAQSFCEERILVIEAETGLGKSLAYLVPLLIYCAETNSRAVVSTYTRTLQRQLIEKDYPLAVRTAQVAIEAAVLLGRTNYLCKKSLSGLMNSGELGKRTEDWLRSLFDHDSGEIEHIDMDAEIDSSVLQRIACPAGEADCVGCSLRDECYLYRARSRAMAAQVVLVNHALLFSDLSTNGALLGPFDVLVVDEAHHLPEVATRYLTLSVSPQAIDASPQGLHTNRYDEPVAYARDMTAADDPAAAEQIDASWTAVVSCLEEAHRATLGFFSQVTEAVGNISIGRGRTNDSNYSAGDYRYYEGSPLFYHADSAKENIMVNLDASISALERLLAIISRNEILSQSTVPLMLRFLCNNVMELTAKFDFITSASDSEYVFYAGLNRGGSVSALHAMPIDVSAQLGVLLEERCRSTLLTSATLAVGSDFSYMLSQLGLDSSAKTITGHYTSPFDLNSQRAIFLATYMPNPADRAFVQDAADTIIRIARSNPKNILVLCTAKTQLERLYGALTADGAMAADILAQRQNVSRSVLIDRFKKMSGHKILLGLASFWEGVDFPGEYLEIVVVMKMPFLVPTEPLYQAKVERLRARGENPFQEIVLPDAVLKLRQGFGRLIRTSSDRGAVIILDARLKDRPYGAQVLQAVSDRVDYCDHPDDIVAGIDKVFR
ncbi:MAG: ATP-dependent DNA helicase [Candidatus Latescibacterota bacterium]